MVKKHISTTTCESEKDFKFMVCRGLDYNGFHVQWHEDRYGLGIPDVSYGFGGINGWIEFKWLKTQFEPLQPRWLADRSTTGGHVFVLTGHHSGMRLIEWGSMSAVTIIEPHIQYWLPILIALLTLDTPYGGDLAPEEIHDQVTNQIPHQVLKNLGSSEIEALPGRKFPFPANLGEYLLVPATSSIAS